jgi:PPK2 family polyphosphate:nucleotide phosphotransferase
MAIDPKDYRVRAKHAVKLGHWPTAIKPLYRSEEAYQETLSRQQHKLDELQKLLYAERRHALLVIFQGMDAAGKDSAIAHIFGSVNPQGCEVFSFQQPSAEELKHDFLWRAVCRLPERGRIGIFNRSYYEDVLVVKVHPKLLDNQALPHAGNRKTLWKERYRSIDDLERHLCRNGTTIAKFFLHLSREEQRKRFLQRIDDEDKNWKLSTADLQERKFWPDYMAAYSACLAATSSDFAPWYIVPADDKKNTRLIISGILIDILSGMGLRYPRASPAHRAELVEVRRELKN